MDKNFFLELFNPTAREIGEVTGIVKTALRDVPRAVRKIQRAVIGLVILVAVFLVSVLGLLVYIAFYK